MALLPPPRSRPNPASPRPLRQRLLTLEGAGCDRDGRPELYYTIFVLAGLEALRAEIPRERVSAYLQTFSDGEGLDFVHLGALARCWAAVDRERAPRGILARIERHRAARGGFVDAYGGFVALGAYQDLGVAFPE